MIGRKQCLLSDAETVKRKYSELEAAGSRTRLHLWAEERRQHVKERQEFAVILEPWLEARRQERMEERLRIAQANLIEVKVRLHTLGWAQTDIDNTEFIQSHLYIPSVLDVGPLKNEDWEALLPEFFEALGETRRQRLLVEAAKRKQEREHLLRNWLLSLQGQTKLIARVAPKSQRTENCSATSPSSNGTTADIEDSMYNREYSSLFQPLPHPSHILSWPEYKTLLEQDEPIEVLESKLEAQANGLMQLIDKWRVNLERMLVERMPEDTLPVDNDSKELCLTTGSMEEPQPISSLDLATRKLLRADAIFKGSNSFRRLSTYPEDFYEANTGGLPYHPMAASIGRAMLNDLQQPNASYLEMKAMGDTFLCGRCYGCTTPRAWMEMIQHYLAEKLRYESTVALCNSRNVKDFTYVFDHDVTRIIQNRPLVQVRDRSHIIQHPNLDDDPYLCKICIKAIGFMNFNFKSGAIHGELNIKDHVQNIHLVKNPELRKHYVPAGGNGLPS